VLLASAWLAVGFGRPCWPPRRVPRRLGLFLRGAGRGRGQRCSSAFGPWAPRGVGRPGGGVRRAVSPSPRPPRGFPRGPVGARARGARGPLRAVASTSSDPPPQRLRDGVRRGRFGLGRNGWGSANSLAMRDVTVVPVLSGGGRRPRPTCRDKPVCLGPARVSGPRQGVAWRPGGLHGRCGGGPLQPVGFAK